MSIMEVFPPANLLLPFLVAGVALNLTPGSDMTFVALAGARGGRAAGLAAAAGISVGGFGHILLAVLGLSALIAASQTAFAVVKWLGVAYLIYLAVQLIRTEDVSVESSTKPGAFGPGHAFRQAAVVNLMNPKVGIFFLAFLPQFIEPEHPAPWQQILALGILFNFTGTVVNGTVGLSSAAVANRFRSRRSWRRVARWFAATVMGGLAVKLAVSGGDSG